jgi:alkylation response protein AidB-like acyl-CoA dehydrogenase
MVLGHLILAPILGIAQGIVDQFDERIRTRRDPQTMRPAVEREANQLRFAEATAKLFTANLLLERNLADLRESGEARAELTLEQRATIRRNLTYARKLAVEAGNSLIDGADSSAMYEVNHLHRLGRDLRAAALQFTLFWEEAAIQYSRVMWGFEPQTIVI